MYWATAGGWWDGVITDFNMLTGQHWRVALCPAAVAVCQSYTALPPVCSVSVSGHRQKVQSCSAEAIIVRLCSVVYDYGTPDESFEWTQIRGAKGGEVQVLDDTVDLLQV